jgi:hypothetical protein
MLIYKAVFSKNKPWLLLPQHQILTSYLLRTQEANTSKQNANLAPLPFLANFRGNAVLAYFLLDILAVRGMKP